MQGYVTNGYCNCNECKTSNVSLVLDVTIAALQCPKEQYFNILPCFS